MFIFAIETNGRTVAYTKEVDLIMLEGVLTGKTDEGQKLRDGLSLMCDSTGPMWDGKAPLTPRLATASEPLITRLRRRDTRRRS